MKKSERIYLGALLLGGIGAIMFGFFTYNLLSAIPEISTIVVTPSGNNLPFQAAILVGLFVFYIITTTGLLVAEATE